MNDKTTMIRSMSYTPNGLFNHTAAIYQIIPATRPTRSARRASSSRRRRRTSRTSARNIIRLKPPTEPMLPFVMLPRPLQESNVVGKGGTAGFLGRAVRPVHLFPAGDDMDMDKMDRIKVDDLQLRPEVSRIAAGAPRPPARTDQRRACRRSNKAVAKLRPRRVLRHGAEPDPLRPGPRRVRSDRKRRRKMPRPLRPNTFGQSCCSPAAWSKPARASSKSIWPKVANSDNHSWDVHVGLARPHEEPVGADARHGLSALIDDLDERGLLDETLVVAVGEFGRSPQRGVSTSGNSNSADGRDHWPYCYTAVDRRRRRQTRLRPRQESTTPPPPRSKTRSTRRTCSPRSTTPSASTRTP